MSRLWFILGCITAALQTLHPLRPGFGRGWEMLNAARTLAEKGVFGDPFYIAPTGPTAMIPPGYPFLLSYFIRWFGDGPGFMWAAILVCIVGHGLCASLLPAVGERLLGDRRAGHAAALAAVALPAFPLMPQWDTILTSAGLLGYLALGAPGMRAAGWLGWGAAAGFLALWNPITAPAAALRIPWLLPRKRAAAVFAAAWFAGFFAVAGLWMARNKSVLGAWTMRTNLGTTLYVSNNDCAQPHILNSIDSGCYNRNHPNMDRAEAGLVVAMGEPAYDRKRTRDAVAWMKDNPARTLELSLARMAEYWFPHSEGQTPYAEAIWLTTALSIAGLGWLIRARAPGWLYLMAVSLCVPLPYYFVVADIRYRAPILWAAQLAAGFALARIWHILHLRSLRQTRGSVGTARPAGT